MSRSYEMHGEITGIKGSIEAEKIEKALDQFVPEVDNYGTSICFFDNSLTLAGGTSTAEWKEGIVEAVWTATKRPVEIDFSWWHRDREPDEKRLYDEEEFNEMFPALKQLAMTAEED